MRYCFVLALLLGMVASAAAEIDGFTPLMIDLTKPKESADKVTWSDHDHFDMTSYGFGWNGEAKASRDGWIETQPLGIGTSWRPTQNAQIRIKLGTNYPAIVKTGENSKAFYVPAIYVRYSSDRKHWSDWQALSLSEDPRDAGKVLFTGDVGVARRSSQDYYDRMAAWQKRKDIAWGSDEEEFCRWLVTQEPKYFEQHRPFVGYVQFLIEGSFRGNQRLQSLDARIAWGVGGIHTPPRDSVGRKKQQLSGTWRFPQR